MSWVSAATSMPLISVMSPPPSPPRRRGGVPQAGWGVIVALFFTAPLFATVIVQKNGDVISGRILEEKTDKYVFQSPYGKLQIAKNNVAKLILDEKTIELKNVTVGDKTVKARLVNQDKNTSVYLTEDGRTIRKDEKEEKPPATAPVPAGKETPRDKVIIGLTGFYGFSTFQRESDATTGGMPPLDQSFHGSTFGAKLSAHYSLIRFLGVGVQGAFIRAASSVTITAPTGTGGSHDGAALNTSLTAAPSLIFSLLGNLGSTIQAHDLRLEIAGGMSFNSAELQLTFRNSPNFPTTASATGKNQALALDAQLYYTYSFSESFRLRLGAGYQRFFFRNIYEPGLQSASSFPGSPGGFQGDFEKNLAVTGSNPQIISLLLGFEVGF